MAFNSTLKRELKALGVTTLFFACWIAGLLAIKSLVLAEYHIEFRHYSMALIGALVLAKVVLLLEPLSFGSWSRSRPAWAHVVLRTMLYLVGVVVVMAVEKSLEGRHEHGGFVPAIQATLVSTDSAHMWANTVCLSGALLAYNILAVIRRHLGEGGVLRLFLTPLPTPSGDSFPETGARGGETAAVRARSGLPIVQ